MSQRRPVGLLVAILLLNLSAVPPLLIAVLLIKATITHTKQLHTGLSFLWLFALICFGISFSLIAVAIGLWNRRNWARKTGIALCTLGIAACVLLGPVFVIFEPEELYERGTQRIEEEVRQYRTETASIFIALTAAQVWLIHYLRLQDTKAKDRIA